MFGENLGSESYPIFFIISESGRITILDILADDNQTNSVSEFRSDYIQDLEADEWDTSKTPPGVYRGDLIIEYFKSWTDYGYEYDSKWYIQDEKMIYSIEDLLDNLIKNQAEEEYYKKCLNMREKYD